MESDASDRSSWILGDDYEDPAVASARNKADDQATIKSAGGIIRRLSSNGKVEVVVIYRQRRGDWTFPKGKVNPGETSEQTALREVFEETGMRCRILSEVGATCYVHRSGMPKEVTYFLMAGDSEPFTPSLEVDELLWLAPSDAQERLTWDHDRALLSRAVALPDFTPAP